MNMFYKLGALLIVASSLVLAADNQLEDALNHQYKDRVYTLRQPMTAPTQQYDSLGNSPTASALGPWTIYGRVQIRKIKLEPTRLVVEGRRIGMKFDDRAKTLVPARLDDHVKLEISLARPLDSADQINTIFSRVFAFSKEDFLASLPVLWRQYLTDNLVSYGDDGRQLVFKPYQRPKQAGKRPELTANGVYYVGDGVTAPKPRFTPDPDYSLAARAAKLEATLIVNVIVDKTGAVRKIGLVRPAGLGLDEQAAQAVATWKFDPAQRNGEPVPVEVSVEVSFNLW